MTDIINQKIASVKSLVAGVIETRENSNDLVSLIDQISTTTDVELLKETIDGVVQIFRHAFNEGDVNMVLSDDKTEGELCTEMAYKVWMKDRFDDAFAEILNTIPNKEPELQQFSIEQALVLLRFESRALILSGKHIYPFPEDHLSNLIKLILLLENIDLSKLFSSCLKFEDFRFFSFKAMPSLISHIINNQSSQERLNFLFSFLKLISNCMPSEIDTTTCELFSIESSDEIDAILEATSQSKILSLQQHRKLFGAMWLEFLKAPMPGSLHKQVLMIMHTHLIPNFSKARLLADFLIKSYSRGGGLALLGLQGLFSLMQEHNLEYPDFYLNLYGMLHPRIFEEKYASRFFYLLNLFLSSTHLPSYLVAAFVKKLARLCLVSPPNGTHIMVELLLNLLRRHPSIQNLLHINPKKNGSFNMRQNDPFLADEIDPAKCKAMESSLWEIKALGMHYCPSVAQAASITKLGTMETDIGEALDMNSKEIFDQYASVNTENCALNYIAPTSLFNSFENQCSDLWSV